MLWQEHHGKHLLKMQNISSIPSFFLLLFLEFVLNHKEHNKALPSTSFYELRTLSSHFITGIIFVFVSYISSPNTKHTSVNTWYVQLAYICCFRLNSLVSVSGLHTPPDHQLICFHTLLLTNIPYMSDVGRYDSNQIFFYQYIEQHLQCNWHVYHYRQYHQVLDNLCKQKVSICRWFPFLKENAVQKVRERRNRVKAELKVLQSFIGIKCST